MNQRSFQSLILSLLILMIASGCNQPLEKTAQPSAEKLLPSPQPVTLPLSVPGPYHIGTREYKFVDMDREGRKVGITLWYPALQPAGSTVTVPIRDAQPDLAGAPYPLILSSTKMARILAPNLVSRGFIWASVDGIDTYLKMNEESIDQPRDLLFTLDQIASDPPEGMEGMIDTEHVGVTGYSFDGYNTYALSGARIDPQYYLAQCPDPDKTTKAILSSMSAFDCSPADNWAKFTAHAGGAITTSEDGMWQPMTDERIRAVMPMAGEGWWIFGEKGLAAVDRPVLVIAATGDVLYPENVLIYDHLGTPDKVMISFVGRSHMMVYAGEAVARMSHFAAAFFGYQLQGRKDYADYFSQEFISRYDDLVWGVVRGE